MGTVLYYLIATAIALPIMSLIEKILTSIHWDLFT